MARLSYRSGVRRYVVACALLTATRGAGADEVDLTLEVGLRARALGAPVALAPDAWLDLPSGWRFGVIHSNASVDRVAAGGSLCVRTDDLECTHVYRGSGIDALWRWRPQLAPRARLLLRDVDPVKPAVTLGALASWQRGRWIVGGDPYLRLGLANRDRGNRAAIVLPAWLAADVGRARLAFITGWDGELAILGDGWHIPIAASATVRTTPAIDLSLTFGWPSLLGPQNDFRNRALFVAGAWHR